MTDFRAPLLVSCLCAAWCRVCDDYRAVFDSQAAAFAGRVRFVWVDIEDDEEALGDIDIVDFPTLLIARDDALLFFGPVLPHAQTLRQLIDRALDGALVVAADVEPAVRTLPARIAAWTARR